MLVYLAVGLGLLAVVTLAVAGNLVVGDFLGAMAREYGRPLQLHRRRRSRSPAQRARRLGRRGLYLIKRPIYLVAVALGLRDR